MTSKLRKGDRVSIEGVIVEASPVELTVRIGVNTTCAEEIRITPHNATLVQRGPPQVGDSVIHKDNECETFAVLAIDGLSAWVRSYGGHMYSTVLLANLTVVRAA
jgi:hypothetical protein